MTASRPLDGVNVLDFCWVAVGPMTTKYLGEHGATVVRVESAKRPGTLRSAAPFPGGVAGINRSAYFASYNANKMGITVDMRHPRARDLMLRLAGWAHIVTENFTPGTMEGWGLGFEEMQAVNPGLVMFSASMMGRGGPMERQPGFGPVLSSLVGLTNVTGWPDRTPVNPYGAYTDFIVPRFAVAAILAALDHSRRTGEGRHLDLSQLETSMHFLTPFLLDYTANGREQQRQGNRDPGAAPSRRLSLRRGRPLARPRLRDRKPVAVPTEDRRTGRRAAALRSTFATLLERKANEDELDRLVSDWTSQHDQRSLMHRLQEAGVPAGMVNDPRDLFEDPQLRHREHFQWLDHPEIGPYATDRSEFTLSLTPGYLDMPAPLLGQHNEHFFRQVVGLSEDEYRSLETDGVLE